jgi:hypothetical protein
MKHDNGWRKERIVRPARRLLYSFLSESVVVLTQKQEL